MPSTPQLYSLPYLLDSARLFSAIAAQPWSIFLDSGLAEKRQGRYDIFATEPLCTLITHGAETQVCSGNNTYVSKQDPFTLVKQQLTAQKAFPEVPFNGGAIGYFAYDLGRQLEKIPKLTVDAEHIPDMAVGVYQWAVVVDHQEQKSYLVGCADSDQQWQALIKQFSAYPEAVTVGEFQVTSSVQANMSEESYAQAFAKIKKYLQEGDCYQVNLAQRFVANCQGDPWAAYQQLRKINSAPFSGYLNVPGVQVLSSSPERFLKVFQGRVETKPIKGTRPRKENEQENQQQIDALQRSHKDRAENVMIVDLLRNDISKNCIPSSVKVPKLFEVESYATVHHLVSTVTGRLDEKYHALDLLRSCFPGGSITGAPKIRAMEVIEELEPNRRGVYCGAIAYIGFDGNMDSNIAIRTLVHSEHTIRFWAGGGIVNDSVLEEEYQECFDKAAAMLSLLAQMQVS
ncbi:aminodeoxychorismate synthase component I [methanotrophic endosymbiont of Bathymodiolus puteoserpentis (Logatchev)]|jgi:para-aminobenzoate synthetase component 1|uniref:aminodeoxychorismate synthase component I n=1 Tax=methanotrophic endosymbiont of Bathymodiolus puteoserpentis (Logatchev) TaxID=343235 RepID=UPI0013C60515|nr:aminodeoxychorismate synthase component I [methanotrophic endosymbiont of Bathymodiolus puteoserpentis (Logatchev)]SHE22283.1 Para-aminobenzoate synthase, aminase component [methanotrophic endosymbiont of Bathymodiolus puteoserpentis (Logatchev)]